ncbi:MAG: hypothetical protein ACOVNY_05280 [Chitinophagaceae bacterium]
MKKYVIGFWYSLPIQLLFLHFRKYQVFLVFWYILFATIANQFLNTYGAASLFLAPEYMGKVNMLSTAIVGMSIGIFIMSWNITTFILHSKYIKFLATTAQPFLKFCINNAIIPLVFLVYYFFRAYHFERHEELNNYATILVLVGGFLLGFLLALLIAFFYFFSADRSIFKRNKRKMLAANKAYIDQIINKPLQEGKTEFRVDWFLSAFLHLRKPRDVRHYSEPFLDGIFKRHHLAAVTSIFIAFVFLIAVGYFSDNEIFQLPAAASITILFAILIAAAGAFSLFLKSWSIPVMLAIYSVFNYLYVEEIFDPRNKVFGLNYYPKSDRPKYDFETIQALASDSNMQQDKLRFLQTLERWKEKQEEEKPVLFIINVSGGGTRSATFTMHTLQLIDSALGGTLLSKTILINGASGGMLGAAYYRDLYLAKISGNKRINLLDKTYVEDISKDLLNPLFSSFVSRDIIGPVQKFSVQKNEYTKDRGYAFEQKLGNNTRGLLNKPLSAYTAAEMSGKIPTMIFNAVINKDGRKMMIATQPFRFLMTPPLNKNNTVYHIPDAVDFNSFFSKQNPTDIRVTSALRMNATFPYVLPNVWLPTKPIIDVMDAGLRDNFGQETGLRLLAHYSDWMLKNTRKVVVIQIRDHAEGNWEQTENNNSIISFFTKPFLLLQNNWFKMQDYYQHDQYAYLQNSFGNHLQKISFQYIPDKNIKPASLSFHLTQAEKKEIAGSLHHAVNKDALQNLMNAIRP